MKRDREKDRDWRRRSARRYRENRRKRLLEELRNPKSKVTHRRMRSGARPTTGYRLWVRETRRCAIPGCDRPFPDPHHVRARGMGRTANPWKEDEGNVCPLCRQHHQLGDSPGWSWKRVEHELQVDLEKVARELWDAWMALPQETRDRWEQRAYRINRKRGAKPARRPR